jgi:hypothetical protein
MLTVFHTFVSMFISIALAELWFSARAGRPWLKPWGIAVCAVVPLLIALGNLSTKDHNGKVVLNHSERVITFVVMLLAVALALVLPRWRIPRSEHAVPTIKTCFSLAFAWFVVYLFSFFGLVRIAPHLVPLAAFALWAVAIWAVLWWTGSSAWTKRHTLWLCVGVLAPSMLLTSVRIIFLQPVASGIFIWLVVRLDRRLRPATNLQ